MRGSQIISSAILDLLKDVNFDDDIVDISKMELYKHLILGNIECPFIYVKQYRKKLKYIGGLSIKTYMHVAREELKDEQLVYYATNKYLKYIIISDTKKYKLFKNI